MEIVNNLLEILQTEKTRPKIKLSDICDDVLVHPTNFIVHCLEKEDSFSIISDTFFNTIFKQVNLKSELKKL